MGNDAWSFVREEANRLALELDDLKATHALLIASLERQVERWTGTAKAMEKGESEEKAKDNNAIIAAVFATSGKVYRRLASELSGALESSARMSGVARQHETEERICPCCGGVNNGPGDQCDCRMDDDPTDDEIWDDATKRIRPGEDTGLFCGVIPEGKDQ